MPEINKEYLVTLIATIEEAELEGSVTNEMVAEALDILRNLLDGEESSRKSDVELLKKMQALFSHQLRQLLDRELAQGFNYNFGTLEIPALNGNNSGNGVLVSECMGAISDKKVASLLEAIDNGYPIAGSFVVETTYPPTSFNLYNIEVIDSIEYPGGSDYKIRAFFTESTNDNMRLRIAEIVFKRDEYGRIYLVRPIVRTLDIGILDNKEIDLYFTEEWIESIENKQTD